MRDLGADLERRETTRHRHGADCDLFLVGRSHPATIVDLSRGGGFVQCEAPAWPGALVRVRLRDIDRYGIVLRERHVPHQLRSLVSRGFGVRWVRNGGNV